MSRCRSKAGERRAAVSGIGSRAAVAVFAAVLFLAAQAASAQAAGAQPDALEALRSFASPGTVSVSGTGSVQYTPEFADMRFSVVTLAPGYAQAQKANMAAVSKVIATLSKTPWIAADDLATESFSLAENVVYENGRQNRDGYRSVTVMSLHVRALDHYADILVSLLDCGVNEIGSVSFGVADEASLRVQALSAAFADAERKAAALARQAGRELGKARVIREAGVPAPTENFALKAMADSGRGDIVAEGRRTLRAEVYVEFALK